MGGKGKFGSGDGNGRFGHGGKKAILSGRGKAPMSFISFRFIFFLSCLLLLLLKLALIFTIFSASFSSALSGRESANLKIKIKKKMRVRWWGWEAMAWLRLFLRKRILLWSLYIETKREKYRMIALNEEEKCLSLVGTGNWKAGESRWSCHWKSKSCRLN